MLYFSGNYVYTEETIKGLEMDYDDNDNKGITVCLVLFFKITDKINII